MPPLAFTKIRIRSFAIMMMLSAASASAGAQDSTRAVAPPDSLASWYRDPQTAQALGSFIPGAGHIYAGESLRGLGLGGAAVISIASGIFFLNKRDCHFVNIGLQACDSEPSSVNTINGITQLAVGVAAWVFGAIDAPRAAQRANERWRRRVAVAPLLRDDLVRQPALGVAVTVSW